MKESLWKKVKAAQSCPTLWPHKLQPARLLEVHGILQARILEWVAIPFSRGSSQPGDWTQVSCIAGGFFPVWATREAQNTRVAIPFPSDLPDPGIKPRSPALQADTLLSEPFKQCQEAETIFIYHFIGENIQGPEWLGSFSRSHYNQVIELAFIAWRPASRVSVLNCYTFTPGRVILPLTSGTQFSEEMGHIFW